MKKFTFALLFLLIPLVSAFQLDSNKDGDLFQAAKIYAGQGANARAFIETANSPQSNSFDKFSQMTGDELLLSATLKESGIAFTREDLKDYAHFQEIPLIVVYVSPVEYYPQKRKDYEISHAPAAKKNQLQAQIASIPTIEDLAAVAENAQTITRIQTAASSSGAAMKIKFKSVPAVSLVARRDKLKETASAIRAIPKVAGMRIDPRTKALLNSSVPLILGMSRQQWSADPNYGYDGTGMRIAILDTGIDITQKDLDDIDDNSLTSDPKVINENDFTFSGSPSDNFGHGTHVASIAAGTGEASAYKFTGVAPKAFLLNGKVLDDTGSGYFSWIIAGIEWAVANNADVISMSLGGYGRNPDGENAVRQAVLQGVPVVVAAGNSGPSYYSISTPGVTREAITVGASDNFDYIASFSSRGPTLPDYQIKPDVVAPGVDICASRVIGSYLDTNYNGAYRSQLCGNPAYFALSGTSMATPHVAGAVALLKQANPDWSPERIKAELMSGAESLEYPHCDQFLICNTPIYNPFKQGAGRINLNRTVHNQNYVTPASLSLGVFSPSDTSISLYLNLTINGSAEIGYALKDIKIRKMNDPSNAIYSLDTLIGGCTSQPVTTIPFTGDISTFTLGHFSGYLELVLYSDCTRTAEIQTIDVPISLSKMNTLIMNITVPPVYNQNFTGYEGYDFGFILVDNEGNQFDGFWEMYSQWQKPETTQTVRLVEEDNFEIIIGVFTSYASYYSGLLDSIKFKHSIFVRNVNIPASGIGFTSIDERAAQKITSNAPQYLAQLGHHVSGGESLLTRPCIWQGYAGFCGTGLFAGDFMQPGTVFESAIDLTDVTLQYRYEGALRGSNGTEYNTSSEYSVLPFTIGYPFSPLYAQIPASEIVPVTFMLDNPFNHIDYVGINLATYSKYRNGVGLGNGEEVVPKAKKYWIRKSGACDNCHYWVVAVGLQYWQSPYDDFVLATSWDGGHRTTWAFPLNNPPLEGKYYVFYPPFKFSLKTKCTQSEWVSCFYSDRVLFGDIDGLQQKSMTPVYFADVYRRGTLNVSMNGSVPSPSNSVSVPHGFSWQLNCMFPSVSWPAELQSFYCAPGIYDVKWRTNDLLKTQTPCGLGAAKDDGNAFQITSSVPGELDAAGNCIPLGSLNSLSKLTNNENAPILGYLNMKIQKSVNEQWLDYMQIYDGLELQIPAGAKISLSDYFKLLKPKISEQGKYRIYADVRDPNGSMLHTLYGDVLATKIFGVDYCDSDIPNCIPNAND